MDRRSRGDVPGSWHHVMNRGIARRTLFEHLRHLPCQMNLTGWRDRTRLGTAGSREPCVPSWVHGHSRGMRPVKAPSDPLRAPRLWIPPDC